MRALLRRARRSCVARRACSVRWSITTNRTGHARSCRCGAAAHCLSMCACFHLVAISHQRSSPRALLAKAVWKQKGKRQVDEPTRSSKLDKLQRSVTGRLLHGFSRDTVALALQVCSLDWNHPPTLVTHVRYRRMLCVASKLIGTASICVLLRKV